MNNKIDLLMEKYLMGLDSKHQVYVNPTSMDIKQMKQEWGHKNIRFFIHKPTKSIYVWDANIILHAGMINYLISKNIINEEPVYTCEYNRPSIICGQGQLGIQKINLARDWSYGDRESEIGDEYSKYFYKASTKVK